MLDGDEIMTDLAFVLEYTEISQDAKNHIYTSMWNLIRTRLE